MQCWLWLTALAALAGIAEGWLRTRGDCHVRLARDRVDRLTVEYPDGDHACLRFRTAFRNTGKEQGLILDAAARLQPEGKRYSELQPVCRLIQPDRPRYDGYWESAIVPAGGELPVAVELWLTAEGIREVVASLGEFRLDFVYRYYCRTPLLTVKEEVLLQSADFAEVAPRPAPPPAEPPAPAEEGPVMPLRTHLLRPGEDVVEVCSRYLEGKARPGDVVAVAESAVAIMQGRVVYCDDVRPGFLATRLNRLFGMHSSLSSVYAMEMALREVGTLRILAAVVAGALGRLMGREGDFYRVAGRAVATIDDCTGTLPPFDKHVVLGPVRAAELVRAIRERTGVEAAIVDANDLGRVDVLALSDPSLRSRVEETLRTNPHGNAAEMTPLVLIRGASPGGRE